jgi:hypothetical protein
VARHQAHHARIQSLRAEAEALEEQLKTSVSALASLRHELFDTPATTFPADTRPVPFDELLQYAKNISKHTVPPTFRERAPQSSADKDREKDDGASSAAPTNGLNTPVVPVAPDTEEAKEGDKADAAPAEITAEEEEWLKKLNESKIAWYPWPSNDKIRTGNLYKLMYWQAKGKDTDDFDIHAYEETERIGDMPKIEQPDAAQDAAQEQEPQAQQSAVPRPMPKPAQPRETFDAFDDLDD